MTEVPTERDFPEEVLPDEDDVEGSDPDEKPADVAEENVLRQPEPRD